MKAVYIVSLILSIFLIVYFCNRNDEQKIEVEKEIIADKKFDEGSDQAASLIHDDESIDTSHQESVANPNSDGVNETKEQKKRLRTRQPVERVSYRDDRKEYHGSKLSDPVFSRPIFNEINFSSTSDESEFLARNKLKNILRWRQLSHVDSQHRNLETLKGRYAGVVQRNKRPDLLVELTIDVEENKFVGDMIIKSSSRKEFSQHPHLKGELKVVEEEDVISIAIFATGHNPSVALQLFFEKENPSEVLGNIYGNQRGIYERTPIRLQRKPI